jgi:hypothetical protein
MKGRFHPLSPMKKPLLAAALLLSFATAAFAQNIATRFGALTINKDQVLLFRGQPVQPRVEGNDSLSLLRKFRIGTKDVVLVQDNGGTACPALYHFVTVSKNGARASKAFGTCTDLIKVARRGDAVVVDMPGYHAPFATQTELNRFLRHRHIFRFKNGVIRASVRG